MKNKTLSRISTCGVEETLITLIRTKWAKDHWTAAHLKTRLFRRQRKPRARKSWNLLTGVTGVKLIVSAWAISIWDVLPKGPCQVPVGDLKFGKRWSSESKWETSRWVAIHYLAPGLLQQAGYESGDQNGGISRDLETRKWARTVIPVRLWD